MMGLTVEEKQRALNYAFGGADFMFIPSPWLCEMIAKGTPKTIEINKVLVSVLLTRKPIRLDTNTVIDYCNGELDDNNTWLLDHGDIKVVPPKYKKPDLVKSKEENDLEEIDYE